MSRLVLVYHTCLMCLCTRNIMFAFHIDFAIIQVVVYHQVRVMNENFRLLFKYRASMKS